jgi:hypothetical protein
MKIMKNLLQNNKKIKLMNIVRMDLEFTSFHQPQNLEGFGGKRRKGKCRKGKCRKKNKEKFHIWIFSLFFFDVFLFGIFLFDVFHQTHLECVIIIIDKDLNEIQISQLHY